LIFTEFKFLIFFFIVFSIYWILNNNKYRKILLLLASYFFYGSWDQRFLILIFISTIVDYVAGKHIFKCKYHGKSNWLIFSLVTNLGLLAVFKYFNFFLESLIQLINLLGFQANISTLKIILPIGISFYTFQSLSYSLDIYYKRIKPCKSFIDFSLFVAFFPQLVAGPIVRAKDFLPQLADLKIFKNLNIRKYIFMFLNGFFKKAVVADNIAYFSDQLFQSPDEFTTFTIILGVISYSIQIYCDFSGYSDMAIASAGFLGYHLPVNFNFPYFASNIGSFWKKWHISLSTWIMDYLFLPIAYLISRRIHRQTLLYISSDIWAYAGSILFSMLLCGLWHGAAWNFIIWGGLHGIALLIHKLWTIYVKKGKFKKIISLIGVPLTFYFVSATWIIFRSPNYDTTFILLKSYITFANTGSKHFPLYLFVFIIILVISHFIAKLYSFENIIDKTPIYLFSFISGIIFFLINYFSQYTYKPFIYFQF